MKRGNKNPNQEEAKSSCLIIGTENVGKKSFISGLKFGYQETQSFSALGMEMTILKKCINNRKIDILLWYTVCNIKFQKVIQKIFEKMKICFLFYDVTNRESLAWLYTKWEELKNYPTSKNIIYMLIGNKCDLEDKREVSYDEGKEFADARNFLFLETSTVSGKNIENAFFFLIYNYQ
ncbi:unnamed protein product [Blepharisma stoltei]|uniref:Uncharacterized protein n=1 Tax=Blepharisma stoltei TaxID=1481888 RepID=A0AAU9IUG6_9CILI|nr:unnamed protein product [Blepharisma stoltei]